MNYLTNERKWQQRWKETELYHFDENSSKPKYYMLEMLPYPSGAKLHIGHWYNYGPADSFARFKRMSGYNVFHPMGFDAFGLPAENYAIKTGVHPKDSTDQNIETMKQQLGAIGATFDWDYTLETCHPSYYKWTQWCFLELYKKGLAYRKQAPVNWCPSCNTVLANEQVVDGACERCESEVVRKNLTQWFFKITDYAEELLQDLDTLDWPHKTVQMQKNWIGKSTGANVEFAIRDSKQTFTIFTTRADTLFGCTYMVLAPEHPLVEAVCSREQASAVEDYRTLVAKTSEIERLSTTREKTGVFTGGYAINPVNGREVPIYIADYVLYSYGTGAVMAVPAHDERDFDFATQYHLPIERVIQTPGELPDVEPGTLIASGAFDGLHSEPAKKAIVDFLGDKAEFVVNYRLRDWLVSRQRYWGAPIPIVYCPACGQVPVPEKDLPVELPYDVDFRPDGTSPLLRDEGFISCACPQCGGEARRESDTMDTFVCSSWYYLRYPDNQNDQLAFDKGKIDKLLPVDTYVGGAEHAVMHLLYARFFTKALRDLGYLSFDEPFARLIHQGTILGPDGNKMSKSKGNVISPDEYVNEYGSDVFRLYLMFGFSYIEGGPWNDSGVKSIHRFVERIQRLVEYALQTKQQPAKVDGELNYQLNYAIQAIREDIQKFQFNTCVARIMEVVNAAYKLKDNGFLFEATKTMMLILAPFAPHFAEEMWERLGQPYSIFDQAFPVCDENALKKSTVQLGIQINGKVKFALEFGAQDDALAMEQALMQNERVQKFIEGKTIVKKIIIPGKIVNLVVK